MNESCCATVSLLHWVANDEPAVARSHTVSFVAIGVTRDADRAAVSLRGSRHPFGADFRHRVTTAEVDGSGPQAERQRRWDETNHQSQTLCS